jgi:hypothetical protein
VAPSLSNKAWKATSDDLVFRESYLARKSIVPFNARLREETDLDASSEGLVGVARHHTAQAHLLVAASRDIFKEGADGLATTYSSECVE